MSARIEAFFELKKVVDHDCGNYRIGEIDFVELCKIRKYIHDHGEFGLSEIYDVCARITATAREAMIEKRLLSAPQEKMPSIPCSFSSN